MNFLTTLIRRLLSRQQTKRVFVSYSSKDSDTVIPIVELLRAVGASVFRDADSIPKGTKWRIVLDQELSSANLLILFCTKNALESAEVKREYSYAHSNGIEILPLLFEPITVPAPISEYEWINLYSVVRRSTSGSSGGGYSRSKQILDDEEDEEGYSLSGPIFDDEEDEEEEEQEQAQVQRLSARAAAAAIYSRIFRSE